MPRSGPRKTDRAPTHPSRQSYFQRSMKPLTILFFLLPFVILYELGSIVYLANEQGQLRETVSAYRILASFFEIFGAFGLYLPGLVLITVLAIQHLLSKDRWSLQPAVLAAMFAESMLLTLPLLMLALIVGGTALVAIQPAELPAPINPWPWQARVTIALGAGLYEELLFRMVLIAIVHALAVDLVKLKDNTGKWLAAIVSAVAFAVYHDLYAPDGSLDLAKLIFLLAAGHYFAFLYLARGFGIVVAVHAIYDVIALVLLGGPQSL